MKNQKYFRIKPGEFLSECKRLQLKNIVIFIGLVLLIFLTDCSPAPTIYTPTGGIRKPELPPNIKAISSFPSELSENTAQKLKEELVIEFNIELLINLARTTNPERLKAVAKVHSAIGHEMQAGIIPDPMLEVYVEDIPVGRNRGLHWTDVGFRIYQEISVSGRLQADRNKAYTEKVAAAWELIAAERKLEYLCAEALIYYWISGEIAKQAKRLSDVRKQQLKIIEDEVIVGRKDATATLEYLKFLTASELLRL